MLVMLQEEVKEKPNYSLAVIGVGLFFIFLIFSFYLLFISRSAASLSTPWQAIRPHYIYVFFGTTLVLGFLISFSKLKYSYLLIFLIFYSFVLHSYLPLTHELIYGADGWRHLAEVNRILGGGAWREVVGGGLLTWAGLISYSIFWWLIAGLSKITTLSALTIIRWLEPVIGSIVLPISIFYLARTLGLGKRASLLTAWFASFPFALQAAGAFTLPVNFWLLIFLALLSVLIQEFKKEAPRRKVLLVCFLVLCLGYSLYPIIFALGWIIAELLCRFKRWPILFAIVAGLFIPLLEFVKAGSHLVNFSGALSGLRQAAGNFTGWYLASGPRPHDIATGNLFFNQAPSYAFVSNLFTAWQWWIPMFMIVFLAVSMFGIYQMFCDSNPGKRVFAIFSLSLIVSYIIGRYFIVGSQLASRRLDAILAIIFIIGFMVAKESMVGWAEARHKSVLPNLISFLFLASIAITASYSLGPDTQTVSANEYKAMQHVWQEEKEQPGHCVIAGTYPLLALEAISAKQIVGGGFPIDGNFAQPELEAILNIAKSDPSAAVKMGKKITGAQKCWTTDF